MIFGFKEFKYEKRFPQRHLTGVARDSKLNKLTIDVIFVLNRKIVCASENKSGTSRRKIPCTRNKLKYFYSHSISTAFYHKGHK